MDIRFIFSKHGWLTKTSQWSTERQKAASFTLDEAKEIIANFRGNQLTAVPVNPEEVR